LSTVEPALSVVEGCGTRPFARFASLRAGLRRKELFFTTLQLNSAPEQDAIDHDRKRTTEPEILDPGPAPARRM
jgi:hypothetical protein